MKNKKKSKRGRPRGSKNIDKVVNKLKNIEPEKVKLIKAIWQIQPYFKDLDIDLSKYSIKELQKHIDFFNKKRRK